MTNRIERMLEQADFRSDFGSVLDSGAVGIAEELVQRADYVRSSSIDDVLGAGRGDGVKTILALRLIALREGLSGGEFASSLLEASRDYQDLDLASFEEHLDDWSNLLDPDDSDLARIRRLTVERSLLPVLESHELTIDVRVGSMVADESLDLVPVVVARLEFDEPVGAGGRATVFQMPIGALADLKSSIELVEGQLEHVAGRLADDLL
jgi:hypothetical protein